MMYSTNVALTKKSTSESLSKANSLYQNFDNDTFNHEDLFDCKDYLHQCHGILTIVGFETLAKLMHVIQLSMERAINNNKDNIISPLLFNKTCLATQNYLANSTENNTFSKIFYPICHELIQEIGENNFDNIELFFPNINYEYFENDLVNADEITIDETKILHEKFRKGLLKLFKEQEKIDINALFYMEEVYSVILKKRLKPQNRLFWKACQVFSLLIRKNEIDYNHKTKKIFVRVEQKIKNLDSSKIKSFQVLLFDILFFITKANSNNPEVIDFINTIGLGSFVVENTAELIINKYNEQHLHVEDVIQTLKIIWESFVSGEKEEIKKIRKQIEYLNDLIKSFDIDSLNTLLQEMISAAILLEDNPNNLNSQLAIEIATALLVIESISNNIQNINQESEEYITTLSQRINFSSKNSISKLDVLEDSKKITVFPLQQQSLKQQVAEVLTKNLHELENMLDNFFREREEAYDFFKSELLLNEIYALLIHLDEVEASSAIENLKQIIKNLTPDSDENACQKIVELYCVIEAYFASIGQESMQFNEFLQSYGLSFDEIMNSSKDSNNEQNTIVFDSANKTIESDNLSREQEQAKTTLVDKNEVDNEVDEEMLGIFLEEVKTVLEEINDSLIILGNQNNNLQALTDIRRGFHTLKGSSKMIGLNRFGDMAWELEKLLNEVLESFEKASADLILLIQEAHILFENWHEGLVQGKSDIDTESLQDLLGQFNNGEPLTVLSDTIMKTISTCVPMSIVTEMSNDQSEIVEEKVKIGDISISQALYEIFMDEVNNILNVLKQQYLALQESTDHRPEQEFLRATHTLTGISGTVRLTSIHEIAHEYELLVKYLFDSPVKLSEKDFSLLNKVNEVLVDMVTEVAKKQKPYQRNDIKEQLISFRHKLETSKNNESAEIVELEENSSYEISIEKNISVELPINEMESDLSIEEIILSGTPDISESFQTNSVELSNITLAENVKQDKNQTDDIDSELLEVFLDEAQELLPQIGSSIRDWRNQPESNDAPRSLKRLLHTVKGSARMAGAMMLGEIVHDMESRIENIANLKNMPIEWFDTLEAFYDQINILLDKLRETGHEIMVSRPEETKIISLEAKQSATLLSETGKTSTLQDYSVNKVDAISVEKDKNALQKNVASNNHIKLRVRSDVADRLVNHVGQVNIIRTRAEDRLITMKQSLETLSENISRMRNQVREIEIQAETQIKTKLSLNADDKASFDPLEFDRFTRLQELTRFLTENVNDVTDINQSLMTGIEQTFNVLINQSRLGNELQHELMDIRMSPFSSIVERLYRIARINSKEVGKRINLDIQGGHLELDRIILDRITAPLEHLLRNAIAHGLEKSEERIQSGKVAIGEIKLELRKEGNEIVIKFEDDGAGLNQEKILKTAIKKGILTEEDKLTEQQIYELIFASGFSTAEKVTQFAGRGVGMDVVRDEINKLGGRIQVSSKIDEGTEFTIYLPLTLNVTQVVMVNVGEQIFAIPSTMFLQIKRYTEKGIIELSETKEVTREGETYEYHYLPHLLGHINIKPKFKRSNSVLLLRSGNERIAVLVDGLSGNAEITIKRSTAQMSNIPGITGVTVLSNGEVAMILNPIQLASHQLSNPYIGNTANDNMYNDKSSTVLVVDDSLTVRKMAERLLLRAGYDVITAKDGVQALEILNEVIPDAVLLDVEMPRMDGFELSRQIRSTPEYSEIPIIMISSRTAKKHRQVAKDIGVDEFLGKPYQDEHVLDNLSRLISRAENNNSIN